MSSGLIDNNDFNNADAGQKRTTSPADARLRRLAAAPWSREPGCGAGMLRASGRHGSHCCSRWTREATCGYDILGLIALERASSPCPGSMRAIFERSAQQR